MMRMRRMSRMTLMTAAAMGANLQLVDQDQAGAATLPEDHHVLEDMDLSMKEGAAIAPALLKNRHRPMKWTQ
jgi:hypothetical protein